MLKHVKESSFHYTVYNDILDLPETDQALLLKAREIALQAYAPYSGFMVGAAALMANNTIVVGTNQENASYPIGICAERVLLAAVSSLSPNESIQTMAISYFSNEVDSSYPVAPCGMCRQALVEFENRYKKPMRLILSGSNGEVFELNSASLLLPFSFKAENLGK
jgi:cytidine deaminase